MKLIGIIGGISWVSTIDYYKAINEGINAKLGKSNFAELIIYSFNYQDIIDNHSRNDLEATYRMLLDASVKLKSNGVKALILGANTMHMHADRLEKEVNLPVIHIAKATASTIKKKGLKKVGLLGTKYTMEQDFFKDKLKEQGIEAVIPYEQDREFIHRTIFDELGSFIIKPETKARYLSIMKELESRGAEGMILGCTEIPLLVKQADFHLPLFDTVAIHSQAAVEFMLG